MTPMRLEPVAPRSRVKHSTTEHCAPSGSCYGGHIKYSSALLFLVNYISTLPEVTS